MSDHEKIIADLRAALTEAEDAILTALPYVEDALHMEGFKPGVVRGQATRIRNTLAKIEALTTTEGPRDV